MNLANRLTMLRVFMIPIFLVFLLGNFTYEPLNQYMPIVNESFIYQPLHRYIAILIFVLASVTDALDGYIARSRNMITNLGKFMDPVADKLLVCSALIAMVELDILSAWVVIIIISRDFILMTFRMVASSNNVVIAADKIGKIKTVAQMVMIVYMLFSFTGSTLVLIGDALVGLVIVLTVLSAASYIFKNLDVIK